MSCEVCGIEFESKRTDAKYCSPKCRKLASRGKSLVTDNVTLSAPNVTDNLWFEFYVRTIDRVTPVGKVPGEKSTIRKAKYWYDVPIAAIPVIKKGNPEMPEYMNGRQYFLWWKNEFKLNTRKEKPGFGYPEIHNPFSGTL